MRGNIPAYELIAPRTLAEVLARLSAEPGVWRPFAGGTDLMVLLESGHLAQTKFISLWGLAGLDRIEVTESGVTIGALATYTDIAAHPVIRTEFPNLSPPLARPERSPSRTAEPSAETSPTPRPRPIRRPRCSATMPRSSWSRRVALGSFPTRSFTSDTRRRRWPLTSSSIA